MAYSAVFDEQIANTKESIVKQIWWKLSITIYFRDGEWFIFSQGESIVPTRPEICLCYIRPFFLWNVTFFTFIGAAYSLSVALLYMLDVPGGTFYDGNIAVIVGVNVWKFVDCVCMEESKNNLASSIAQSKMNNPR